MCNYISRKIIYYKKKSTRPYFRESRASFHLQFCPSLRGYRILNRVSSYSIEDASTRNTYLLFSLLRISFFGAWFNMERACPFSMWAFRFVDVRLYSNARFIILVHSCQTTIHNKTTSLFLYRSVSLSLTRYIFLILFQMNYYERISSARLLAHTHNQLLLWYFVGRFISLCNTLLLCFIIFASCWILLLYI